MKIRWFWCVFAVAVFGLAVGVDSASCQTPAPLMADGQPAYKLVGDTTLLHPKILFNPDAMRRLSQPSAAAKEAEKKASSAKVDLSAAIAIIRQNGGFSAEDQQAVAALQKSEQEINELQTLTKQIEAERVARTVEAGEQNAIANEYFAQLKEVERRRAALEEQAAELEAREHFFSTGFYASLAAIGMGVLGFFLQLPTVMLDRRLKQLELVKLENEINAQSDKPKTLLLKRKAA